MGIPTHMHGACMACAWYAQVAGTLRFEVLRFDAHGSCGDVALPTMLLLKDLICKQLPKIEPTYAMHSLLDPAHVAIACVYDGALAAGCVYKPHYLPRMAPAPAAAAPPADAGAAASSTSAFEVFEPPTDSFAELLFFCVESSRQVKGLGTRMMNRLKAVLQVRRSSPHLACPSRCPFPHLSCPSATVSAPPL